MKPLALSIHKQPNKHEKRAESSLFPIFSPLNHFFEAQLAHLTLTPFYQVFAYLVGDKVMKFCSVLVVYLKNLCFFSVFDAVD